MQLGDLHLRQRTNASRSIHSEGFPFNKYNVCQVAECYLTEKELEPERWGVTILGQISNTMPVSILHTQIYTSLLACPQKLPRPHDIFLVRRKQLPVPLCNTRCCYFVSSLCFTCSLRKNKGAWMSAATTGFCI